ncbi:MAG: pirin-like C-terminal cupin domain-containing protein, partial [Gammaproteobacteria bacterium]
AVAAEPVYLDVILQAGTSVTIPIPARHNAFVYCYEGRMSIGTDDTEAVDAHRLAVLSEGDQVRLSTTGSASRAIVVAGRPFGEPVARYGPFVMNYREELVEAVDDLRAGRF